MWAKNSELAYYYNALFEEWENLFKTRYTYIQMYYAVICDTKISLEKVYAYFLFNHLLELISDIENRQTVIKCAIAEKTYNSKIHF